MNEHSPRLNLPLIQPSQAQKHVTHNEALLALDAIVQLALERGDAQFPPSEPDDGALFALGDDPQNAWAGQAGKLAYWDGDAWRFLFPQNGWRGFDKTLGHSVIYLNDEWQREDPDFQNLEGLGVGTGSDSVNKFAVASDATLFTHAGQGHQVKINKSGPDQTASLLFQSGWTGHAEMGITGDNRFKIKVSADGAIWEDALSLAPGEVRIDAPIVGAAVQSDPVDTTENAILQTGAFGMGATAAPVPNDSLDSILATGSYALTDEVRALSPLPVGNLSDGSNLLHLQQNPGNAAQIAIDATTGRMFVRTKTASIWQGWTQIYSQSAESALGTVAMNGAVPTGALMERGETAFGKYLRFADGTQVCTYKDPDILTLVQGATLNRSWTYPIAFAAGSEDQITLSLTPSVNGAANGAVPALCHAIYAGDSTATEAVFGLTNLNAVPEFSYSLTAVGRWA